MYIGSTGKDGLHHLIYEAADNSVDEAMAGYGSLIKVTLNKDGSVTVIDDGRGKLFDTGDVSISFLSMIVKLTKDFNENDKQVLLSNSNSN